MQSSRGIGDLLVRRACRLPTPPETYAASSRCQTSHQAFLGLFLGAPENPYNMLNWLSKCGEMLLRPAAW